MDLKRTKRLLDKINALHTSIGLDNHVNSIERDLMLSYVRQLYDACLDESAGAANAVNKPLPKSQKAVAPPPPPPPAVKPTPAPPVVPVKEVLPPPPPPVMEQPAPAPPPPPAPSPAPKATPPATVATTPKSELPASVAALFQHKAAKELSEKLSQGRIADLTKAMSINDKLLYANELFGRDMTSMTNVLKELNGLASMDNATAKLGEIAVTHNWADDERADIARSFIKLVRRKFG